MSLDPLGVPAGAGHAFCLRWIKTSRSLSPSPSFLYTLRQARVATRARV
jgi:hypothetical protein